MAQTKQNHPDRALDNGSPNVEPAIFVIFGITGDLAQRRLLPALYHLLKDQLLHDHTEIVGISRQSISADELLSRVELCVLENDNVCDPHVLKAFRQRLRIVQLDPSESTDYTKLRDTLQEIEAAHGVCMNRLFYLSIPPQVYDRVVQNLGASGLNHGCEHQQATSRLLVEKPFGYDLTSAERLIQYTARHFEETQIFRIDHYLAKETVQNILVFRQENPIFAELWNNRHVSAITIEMLEQIDIEGRGSFYDHVGAVRDVVQNHLLQLLALVTMELPNNNDDSHTLHHAKQTLLAAIHPINPETSPAYRAQYIGYREAVANPHSTTETYAKLTLGIQNERWQDVPITITTGKALMHKLTAITLTFTSPHDKTCSNKLTFRIQPNEGIDVELIVKRPGFEHRTELVQMDFSYHGVFSEPEHPDAYERVLIDAIRGDHSLFATSNEILTSWRILEPVLDAWEQQSDDLATYIPGSDGPSSTKP